MKIANTKVKIFREVMVALIISGLADMLAGSFLGIFENYLILLPGILLMIPPTMGLRGNVYGALSSRFSTALHLGVVKEDIVKEEFYSTMGEVLFLSFFIPLFSYIASSVLGFHISNYLFLIFVMVFTALFSGVVLTLLTVFIAKVSFEKGWDPDNITSPLITTAGDIITIPTIFLGIFTAFLIPQILQIIIIFLSLFFLFKWFRKKRKFSRVFVMLICAIISGTGGIILENSVFPMLVGTGIIFLLPVFMDEAGNISSVFSSRLGTEYHLGTIDKKTMLSTALIMLASITSVFIIISLISFPVSIILSLKYSANIMSYVIFVGFTVSLTGILIAPLITIFSTKLNLNPDDISIPLITSICDVLSTTILLLTVPLFI